MDAIPDSKSEIKTEPSETKEQILVNEIACCSCELPNYGRDYHMFIPRGRDSLNRNLFQCNDCGIIYHTRNSYGSFEFVNGQRTYIDPK